MQRLSARTRIVAALGVGLTVALVPVASSGASPVTDGKSVLHPDADTFEGLADMSLSVGATGAAKDGRRGVSFPIRSGDVDEGPGGTIEHRGGLVFSANPGAVVKFSAYTIKLGPNKAKLFAKSDHSEVRFLDLDLEDATISGRAGVRLKIKDAEATLAKPAAEVLSEAFDFPFRKGIPIGTMTVKASLTS